MVSLLHLKIEVDVKQVGKADDKCIRLTLVCCSQSKRILIVDDVADNLFLLQTFLESEGYEVETAGTGRSALAQIAVSPPALVLLDVMMPDMDGLEVAQRIRKEYNLLQIPILLITALEQVNLMQGLELGANDFIRKPINFEELLTKIRTLTKTISNP